jgi:uncharacterized integral membrane protein
MRKIVIAVVLVPLAIVMVMFAVANRATVTISLDPFDVAQPAYALTMPLFLLVFLLIVLGVLIGGVATWLKQHRWRVRARRAEADARDLRAQLYAANLPRTGKPAPREAPPLAIPPAA